MAKFFAALLTLALATSANAFIPSANFLSRAKSLRMHAAASSTSSLKLPSSVKPGVVTGAAYRDLIQYAQDKGFAIPGVNTIGQSG